MKKIILITMLVLLSLANFANNNDTLNLKNNLCFSINDFQSRCPSLDYSRKLWNNNWLKVGMKFSGSFRDNTPTVSSSFPETFFYQQIIVSIGFEKHFLLNHNFEIISGFGLFYGQDKSVKTVQDPTLSAEERKSISKSYYYGLDYNLSIFYNFSKNFSIGSSITPNIAIKHTKGETYTNNILYYDLFELSIIKLRYQF